MPRPRTYKSWLPLVSSVEELDGGGKLLAPIFLDILKDKHFDTLFEWCCGPGWIGLWLLENGICDNLVLADINPRAIWHAKKSIQQLGYGDRVQAFVSDNLNDVPDNLVFDGVVGNPPNYCNIQTNHPVGYLRYDLRPSDPGWNIHRQFYSQIPGYLRDTSEMYIGEVALYDKKVKFVGAVYDLRPQIPLFTFSKMIEEQGLMIDKIIPYSLDGQEEETDVNLQILKVQKLDG